MTQAEITYTPTCANCPLGTDLGRNRVRCAAAHNGHNPVRHANDQADIACEEAIEEYHQEVEQPVKATTQSASHNKKYARVQLPGSLFNRKLFLIVEEDAEGVMLATDLGERWFGYQHIEVIDPKNSETTGNYKGLSRQIRKHWEAVDKNPADLIEEMKAKRPPQPKWDAMKYNPLRHLIEEAN